MYLLPLALSRGLNQVDEVAAGVLKQYGSDGPHALRFTTELDAKRLQALVLRADVVRQERRGGSAAANKAF